MLNKNDKNQLLAQSYGSTFGKSGLPSDTYISRNFYGGYRSGVSFPFLSRALFVEPAYRHLQTYTSPWNSEDDRNWRKTTKAPYFENKLPGYEKYLPAAAIVGRFGKIVSLDQFSNVFD